MAFERILYSTIVLHNTMYFINIILNFGSLVSNIINITKYMGCADGSLIIVVGLGTYYYHPQLWGTTVYHF